MKSAIYLIIPLLVGTIACDDPQLEPNFVTAKRNGLSWEGSPTFTYDDQRDTLYFFGSGHEESLSFRFKFRGEGVYDQEELAGRYYTTVGRDVIVSSYILDKSKLSNITVTTYDSVRQSLEGTLELFLINDPNSQLKYPKTIDFTKGRFRGQITN